MFQVTIKGDTFEQFQANVQAHASALLGSTAISTGTVKPVAEVKANASLDASTAKQIAGTTATVVEPKGTTAKSTDAAGDAKLKAAEKAKAEAAKKAAAEKAAQEKAAEEEAIRQAAAEAAGVGEVDPLGEGAGDETAYTMEDARKALMEYRALLPQAKQVQGLADIVKAHGGTEKLVDVAPENYGAIVKACGDKIAELSL